MDNACSGKSLGSSFSIKYNVNNEELEELYHDVCDDDPPTPKFESSPNTSDNASPKRLDKISSSIIDKYFKSTKIDRINEKLEEPKVEVYKVEEQRGSVPKEVSASPVKEYLNRFSKKKIPSDPSVDSKEIRSTENWKIFHDFKTKVTQAVEDIKSRSTDETKEKSVPRDNSMSDSEENSALRDCDQHSIGDTDNQVSSLESSLQNLSEMTQPVTAKPLDDEMFLNSKLMYDFSDDTQKNNAHCDMRDVSRDTFDDSSIMEVESGVEALEDTNMDYLVNVIHEPCCETQQSNPTQKKSLSFVTPTINLPISPHEKNPINEREIKREKYFFSFSMTFYTVILVISYILFPGANMWNGFLLGLWLYNLVTIIKVWLLDTFFGEWEWDKNSSFRIRKRNSPITYTIPSIKEHQPLKKYEGWINHYRVQDYDPYTYHINQTTTAFMKLEGCNLRISYTRTKIAKRAIWNEKIDNVVFYQHRFYNLTGSRIIMLPKGLVRRRQWSKKYPICIILNEKEKIQVLEREVPLVEKKSGVLSDKKSKELENEQTETASPEKKKKFVWRKKEKSVNSEGESSKEGLRHRIVRKMHRDKKTECLSATTESHESHTDKHMQQDELPVHEADSQITSVSTMSTKYQIEDDLDEHELLKIKDFLEETELEGCTESTTEGEWSIQVKESRDKHACLFFFTRTGRDKHEWYRRLSIAISEANVASSESSAAEDKAAAETTEFVIDSAIYKGAESESVTFSRPSFKSWESTPDHTSRSSVSRPMQTNNIELCERNFWPYLFKVIQSKNDQANCTCSCPGLPAEMTWINAVLARFVYDLIRNKETLQRFQIRIQRKLNTMKLPSFMSPLVVTELSIGGTCPLIEQVSGPTWDEQGIWLDANLHYDGGAYITLLTQINLMKLKEKNVTLEDHLEISPEQVEKELEATTSTIDQSFIDVQIRQRRKPAIYDSDAEDSAESSCDEESPPVQQVDSTENLATADAVSSNEAGSSSKKKFLRMVDRIATNKYFQQVTEYKYVKRAMEGLSNTDIKLHLDLRGLDGRLALNIPPPPHDRIWVGFRTNPDLVLKAKPAVGARAVRFAHISNWIEQKLSREFEKVFVLPNMEDIIIDSLAPTPIDFE